MIVKNIINLLFKHLVEANYPAVTLDVFLVLSSDYHHWKLNRKVS